MALELAPGVAFVVVHYDLASCDPSSSFRFCGAGRTVAADDGARTVTYNKTSIGMAPGACWMGEPFRRSLREAAARRCAEFEAETGQVEADRQIPGESGGHNGRLRHNRKLGCADK